MLEEISRVARGKQIELNLEKRYQWLRNMLEEAFGKENVRELVYNDGTSLMFGFQNGKPKPDSKLGSIIAEHVPQKIKEEIIHDYSILWEMHGGVAYSLNEQPNKVKEVEELIETTRRNWSG